MKYVGIPIEVDKRRKLSKNDIVKIKELFDLGDSMYILAKKFKVSEDCIKYWVDDRFRKEKNRKRVLARKEWIKTHPDKVKEQQKKMNRRLKDVAKVYEPMKKFLNEKKNEWKKKKYATDVKFREKMKEKAIERWRKKKYLTNPTEEWGEHI